MADLDKKTETERHLAFVKKIADKIKRQINPPLEVDELVSYGFIGIKQALGRFDASVNVKFETFAYYRIRGAMIEGISKQCHLSRHMARKLQLTQKSNEYMEGASADMEGKSDSSEAANASMLAGIIRDLTCVHTMVSTTIRRGIDNETLEVEFIDEAAASRHEEAVKSSEIRELLEKLTPEQTELMKLYYYHDMTLEEAGKKLGVTKSWACKLHNAAIKKLRLMMEQRGMEPD